MRNGRITAFVNSILLKYNRKVIQIAKIDKEKRKNWVAEYLLKQSNDTIAEVLSIEGFSKSQFKQDLFVLSELDFKEGGYFVEFGATNGVDLSNSHLLEKEYKWEGILSEPALGWHKELLKNRNCNIETDCVWTKTGEQLEFLEAKKGVLSTLNDFKDNIDEKDQNFKSYKVQSISLIDMLEKYNAPRVIDYLSIDTEGSEFQILNSFDFSKYQFRVISVEYNEFRDKIFTLLSKNGYIRKYSAVSECDDWYVLNIDHIN